MIGIGHSIKKRVNILVSKKGKEGKKALNFAAIDTL